jgi:demethylmenaquinone methyltransferase/2-methoxy-6-polyprenyl-1,4-benzoquinol methylase
MSLKEVVLPYKSEESGKKEQVAQMFNNISPKYDLLNHVLSMGIDIIWRKKAGRILKKYNPDFLVDVATGTGDFAIEALKAGPSKVIGVDISDGMLAVGRKKLEKKGLSERIELINGDSEALPFEDGEVDAIIVAFGVRNFENLEKGLSEFHRVLKKGGVAIILEFSKPKVFPIKQVYNVYFKYILPTIGRMLSKDKAAYTYLPESVQAFPDGKTFTDILYKLKFESAKCRPLTLGISSIYVAEK